MAGIILLFLAPVLLAILVLYSIDDFLLRKMERRFVVAMTEILIAFLILFLGFAAAAAVVI